MISLSKKLLFASLLSLSVLSCKEENTETAPATNEAIQDSAAAAPSPTVPAAPASAPGSPVQATPTATAPGMNPPHGQPGHRCDIAVGAPLSSAPAATNGSNATGSPMVQPQAQAPAPFMKAPAAATATPAPTAPGMNPPHGQPGHRCEIAVGAPLP